MDAYEELFTRYHASLYNFAYSSAGNSKDAEEITRQTFIETYETLSHLGKISFSAYLYRTAQNLAANTVQLREASAGPGSAVEQQENIVYLNPRGAALADDPEESVLLDEQQARLRQAWAKLPESMRAILTLREQEQMSYKQMADVIKASQKSTGVILAEARLRFAYERGTSQVGAAELPADCQALLSQISAYLDNELAKKKRRAIEAHLDECALCQLASEDLTEAAKHYGEILPVVPPNALRDDLFTSLRDAEMEAALPIEPEPEPEPEPALEPEPESTFWDVPSPPQTRPFPVKKVLAIVGGGLTAIALGLLFALYAPQIAPDRASRPVESNPEIEVYDAGGGIIPETPTVNAILEATKALEKGVETKESTETSAAVSVEASSTVTATATTENSTGNPNRQPDADEPDKTPPPTPSGQSPANGTFSTTKNVVLSWEKVNDPDKITYSIEIESLFEPDLWQQVTTRTDLAGAAYGHELGNKVERWRVWASDEAGNAGPATEWSLIQYSATQ